MNKNNLIWSLICSFIIVIYWIWDTQLVITEHGYGLCVTAFTIITCVFYTANEFIDNIVEPYIKLIYHLIKDWFVKK